MVTFSQARPQPRSPETLGGLRITETAGYIPAEQQINRLIAAGERLGEYRKELYDIEATGNPYDAQIDPTRSGNFDMADATILARENASKLQKAKKAQEADQKLKKEQAVEAEKAKAAMVNNQEENSE